MYRQQLFLWHNVAFQQAARETDAPTLFTKIQLLSFLCVKELYNVTYASNQNWEIAVLNLKLNFTLLAYGI